MSELPDGPLLVIVSEEISAWIRKGEVTARYYNPGDLFDRVHLVLTNEDDPDRGALQKMAGSAQIEVHNLPPPSNLLRRTLGLRPSLLRRWANGAVELAAEIEPALVRCHGANLNAFAASEINRRFGIPFVVSLHINPDEDVHGRLSGIADRLRARALRGLERRTLRSATLVLPVYGAIVPHLERLGVARYEVAYNMLSGSDLHRKRDYGLHYPVEIVGVGRQIPEKRPLALIEAVATLPKTRLTLIGDGPDHELLQRRVAELGASDRVTFERAVPNDELCSRLPDFDIFAVHSEYWELSKAVLEAFLSALPVVVNRRRGEPVPELSEDICLLVDDTPDSYREALERLIESEPLRRRLGQSAADRAEREWSPARTEEHFVSVYRKLLAQRPRRTPA